MYNNRENYKTFLEAHHIVRRHRDWYNNLTCKYPTLHPIINKVLKNHQPFDWHLLLLEWPHVAEMDDARIAYTRDERAGINDKQTVTTLGKYLRRHFDLEDHTIRDLVALTGKGTCKFVYTTAEMIDHAKRGPSSCMGGNRWRDQTHPFEAYAPEFGWHMAVRIVDDDVRGRAVCMDEGNNKFFVRSFKRNMEDVGGYSYADEVLEAWLKDQGYEHADSWEGCKLAKIESRYGNYVAPYIDGNVQNGELRRDHILITSGGDLSLDSTEGTAGEDDRPECDDCHDRVDEGDGVYLGRWADRMICQSCADYSYRVVNGRNSETYYVHEDCAVEVDGDYYDEDYLGDNDIVELESGEYCHLDNAVCINDAYYRTDDENVVFFHDTAEHGLKSDGWYDEENCEWYSEEQVKETTEEQS